MPAAATHSDQTRRGGVLLLEHCAAIDRLEAARPHAYARLEDELGGRLARLLLGALTGDHRLSVRDLLG